MEEAFETTIRDITEVIEREEPILRSLPVNVFLRGSIIGTAASKCSLAI